MKLLFRLVCFSCVYLKVAFAQKPVFKHYSRVNGLQSDYVNALYQDSKGFLWIASDKGVSRFDGKDFLHFNTDNGLPANMILNIAEDSSQNILLQVYEKGIFCISPELKISPYTPQKVALQKQKDYFSSFLSPNRELVKVILPNPEEAKNAEFFDFKDYEQNTWIGIFGKGIFRYIPYLETYEVNDEITNLYQDEKQIYFLGKKGIHIFSANGSNFRFLPLPDSRALQFWNEKFFIGTLYDWYEQNHLQNLTKGTHCTGIADIAIKAGKMWVATFGKGIIVWSGDKKDTLTTSNRLVSDNLEKIHLSPSYVWVSTYGNGISRINPQTLEVKNFTQKEGLLSNTVYDVFKEKPNIFWIATEKGISIFENDKVFVKIESQEKILSVFRYQNIIWAVSDKYLYQISEKRELYKLAGIYLVPPLQNLAINRVIAKENFVYILTNQGVFRINLDKILHLPNTQPRLQLVSVSSGKENLFWRKGKILEIPPKYNHLSFHFALLSFLNENENSLCYRILGKDSLWNNLPSSHQIHLRNLDYGNFILQVKMKNALGISSETLAIPLIVEKPFWRKWWFITLVVSIVFTLFAFLIRFLAQKRLKKRLQELELTQKMQTEKERIARELHDNIGSQLTYVITSLEQIDKETNTEKQNQRINELSAFTKQTISELRETIWAINHTEINSENLLSRIQETIWRYNQNLTETKILLQNHLQSDFKLNSLEALNIFRIFQESLNNALKHSKAKEIYVILHNTEKVFVLVVQDNGIGIQLDETKLERHYGLKNMQKRAKEINAEFRIEAMPQGTKVTLKCFLS